MIEREFHADLLNTVAELHVPKTRKT